MNKENETKEIIKVVEKEKSIPKDGVSGYLINHQAMDEADSLNAKIEFLSRCRSSIRLGSALLPDNYGDLKEYVLVTLANRVNYIGNRQMVFDPIDGLYSISVGGKEGMVKVRPEEVKEGTESLLNQQANEIIPKLQNLEQVIYEELLALGIIKKTTPNLEDIAAQKFAEMVKKW